MARKNPRRYVVSGRGMPKMFSPSKKDALRFAKLMARTHHAEVCMGTTGGVTLACFRKDGTKKFGPPAAPRRRRR